MSDGSEPWFPQKGKWIVLYEEGKNDEIKGASGQSPTHISNTPERDIPIESLLKNGMINLDKPAGPTSHQVVAWVKDLVDVKRTGHSGTLDPAVSGVLPVALGVATKLLKVLLLGGKEYVGVLELKRKVKEEKLREVMKEFTGEVYQIPPLEAAVKRQLRIRRIYDLDLLQFDGTSALFRTNVESGTYIRNLCVDIGLRLGVEGRMAELRRTRSGQFYEKGSVSLQDVKDAMVFYREDGNERPLRNIILPVERMADHLSEIIVGVGAVDAICHGAPLAKPGVVALDDGIKRGDLIALKSSQNELIAVAKATMGGKEIPNAKRGIVANPVRVVMGANSYPRMWKQKL